MAKNLSTPDRPKSSLPVSSMFLYGCGAGILGVAMMTFTEKIEQFFTSRPNSLVPGKTLARLISIAPRSEDQMWGLNMAMHYGQGALAGVIRAAMSYNGIQGPFADFMFTGIRLLIDQTLENWTGVGALPWTWPVNEQIIDIFHKLVYAVTTGYFTDRLIS